MGCSCIKYKNEIIDENDLLYEENDITEKEKDKQEESNVKKMELVEEEDQWYSVDEELGEIKAEGKKSEKENSIEYSNKEKNGNWRVLIEDNNNFNQDIPFDLQNITFKLQKASESPTNLNPFYTLSAIYDFTKIFKSISSALSMGFADITEKCELMRKRFNEYPDVVSIQDLCNKEIQLDIYKLNGDNNKSLGHGYDEYSKYVSGCRTFLRLLWFLEYLIDIFENVMKDDGNGPIKKILGDSYKKVLSPHHSFLVRRAVGVALSFSNAGNVAQIVELIFGYKEFNEEAIKGIKDTNDLMKKIWNGGNEFYEENNLLELA